MINKTYKAPYNLVCGLDQKLASTIFTSRAGLYCYVSLAKCGCTTIKASLWNLEYTLGTFSDKVSQEDSQIHSVIGTPYVNTIGALGEINLDAFTFTFVRNPYTRILSAYLDRIGRKLDNNFDYNGDDITFEAFLQSLSKNNPFELDRHYRPLSLLSFLGMLNYNYIGKVENLANGLDKVLSRISSYNGSVLNRLEHATQAKNMVKKYYSKKALDIVNSIFHNDFVNFNYFFNDLEHLEGGPLSPALHIDRSGGILYRYVDLYSSDYENASDKFDALLSFAVKNHCTAIIIEACREFLREPNRQVSEQTLITVRKALDIKSENPYLYHQISGVLFRYGDINSAEKAIKQAIAVNSTIPGFHFLFSRILAMKNNRLEAIEAVKKAIKLKGDLPQFYDQLGTLLVQVDDVNSANKAKKKAAALRSGTTQHQQ